MPRCPSVVGFGLALALAIGAEGCATKVFQGPTSGRGAEQQLAVAASAERAFAAFDARPFKGKRVAVEVYGLTEKLEGESPEEAFVRGLLVERLLRGGATVAPTRDDADVLLAAELRSAGVDVITRQFPAIYYHVTFEGVASAQITAYALRQRLATDIIASQRCEGEAVYREIYIFYLFGPIKQRE
jgi:hypothetical protein